MQTINDYFYKYKTFLFGFVAAIVTAIVSIDATNGVEWQDFIVPVVMGIVGWIGTLKRGQWETIVGIVSVAIYKIVSAKVHHQAYTFTPADFQNLMLQIGALYGFLALGPVKPRSYEHDPVIAAAKDGGTDGYKDDQTFPHLAGLQRDEELPEDKGGNDVIKVDFSKPKNNGA